MRKWTTFCALWTRRYSNYIFTEAQDDGTNLINSIILNTLYSIQSVPPPSRSAKRGPVVIQGAIRRPLTTETLVRPQESQREICGGQNNTGMWCYPYTLVLHCHNSTNARYQRRHRE
jgi:hypothetical protein